MIRDDQKKIVLKKKININGIAPQSRPFFKLHRGNRAFDLLSILKPLRRIIHLSI